MNQLRLASSDAAFAALATSSVNSNPHISSIGDALFLLQMARKETADSSLEMAINSMNAKVSEQQALNKLVGSLDGRADQYGNVMLSQDEFDLLKRSGFATSPDGSTSAVPYVQGQNNHDGLIMADLDKPAGTLGHFFIHKERLSEFKDSLTTQITSLSGSNEIQMLQVQRLMNSANEAMQAASTQLKSSHDIAMSIIRNLA